MILLVDTSTGICQVTLMNDGQRHEASWQANRELAQGLLGFLESSVQEQGKTLQDVSAIGVYKGPGSFTGLRIGLSVCNTMADALHIPIVGETGEDWQAKAVTRLKRGENQRLVLPLYGGEANITLPRK